MELNCKLRRINRKALSIRKTMAEGEGFEPPVQLPGLLISSQVPLTTQPPFRSINFKDVLSTFRLLHFSHCTPPLYPLDFNCANHSG